MLVLSRKAMEKVLIGDEIVIQIVRIGPHSVRLGISAPDHMNVKREELANAVRGHDVHVVGYLPDDPSIPILRVAEASGDVGRVVREDGEE